MGILDRFSRPVDRNKSEAVIFGKPMCTGTPQCFYSKALSIGICSAAFKSSIAYAFQLGFCCEIYCFEFRTIGESVFPDGPHILRYSLLIVSQLEEILT